MPRKTKLVVPLLNRVNDEQAYRVCDKCCETREESSSFSGWSRGAIISRLDCWRLAVEGGRRRCLWVQLLLMLDPMSHKEAPKHAITMAVSCSDTQAQEQR